MTNNNKYEDDNLNIDYYAPAYITQHYQKRYIKPNYVKFFNKTWVNNVRLFFQQNKLHSSVLSQITEGNRVLLVGNTYGGLTKKILQKVGNKGKLDVIDALPNQLVLAKQTVDNLPNKNNLDILLQDAKTVFYRKYDVVVMFMLLGEVPDNTKFHILENALRVINDDNAKVVIVDYHLPSFYNPVLNILRLNNLYLQFYVKYLWDNEIENLINKPFNYNITKKTYFAGVYQNIIITKAN